MGWRVGVAVHSDAVRRRIDAPTETLQMLPAGLQDLPYVVAVDFFLGLAALGVLALAVCGTVLYLVFHPLSGRRRG